jgi:hypothetical protein
MHDVLLNSHMEEQDMLNPKLPGYILGSISVACNLFEKTYISVKLTFHITVKERIWKFMPFNWRPNHLH